jgi:NADH:ubiquinone oxidoreductase subunit 6 (subunit J)
MSERQDKNKMMHAARLFLIELTVYAGLVVVYVFFVIAFLGKWLEGLYQQHTVRYAFVSLLLIIGQGVVLEMVTSLLLKLIRSRSE